MKGIKLICFDLNGTLIQEDSWLDLNLAMGMSLDEDQLLMKLGNEGILSYQEAQDIICKIYKKRGKATIQNIKNVLSAYNYMSYAKEIVEYLHKKKYYVSIISGSMDLLVEIVAKELNIQFYETNNIFIFDTEGYLENIVSFGEDPLVKLRHLESFCRRLGIKVSECACIGEGSNDIELFQATGNGITFSDSKIIPYASKVINSLKDLEKIF